MYTQRTSLVVLLLFSITLFAQKENLGTEVVNVVKPYTATISDAFKVKETPSLDDDDNAPKQQIQYNIFSFPVASTFTPAKGKAASVDKTKKEKLYNNYATLGFGNYGNAIGELFVTENFNRNEYVGAMLRHHSSQGGIKGVDLNDKFYNTSLDLTYGNHNKDLSWNADAGYQHQIYNWYGLPELYRATFSPEDYQTFIGGINEQQTYHHFYAGARLELNDSFFHGATLKYQRFWDAFNSAENRLVLKPTFEVEISETKVKTEAIVDYLSGTFARDYEGDLTGLDYGFTNLGIHPSFVMNKEDWTINVGLAAFYSIASEGDNKFFVYPKINASYKLVGDLMIFYAGAEGNLRQNSFRDFTNANPFVSPTFFMAPTDQQYDIFGGLKGKLASNVSYNVRASYMNERGRALFRANPLDPNFVPTERPGYALGNSFDVVYDDVKTLSIGGEVKADINKDFSIGFNGTFNHFSTDNQAEAWNLPAIELGGSFDVNITSKWFAGAKVFFVGERKDQLIAPDVIDPAFYSFTTVSLDSFFDANAHLGYKHNERLTGFLRLNNLANQNYQRWLHYPVQGFQVLLGANYKFDF